jgi:hypothetical protein
MRANRNRRANNSLGREGLNVRAEGWSYEEPDHLLLGCFTLHERRRHRSRIFVRDRATRHVCATVILASLLARRI